MGKRLCKENEESLPIEIYSGDEIGFGIDVVEGQNNVAHKSVVGVIQLFLPNGQEAKTRLFDRVNQWNFDENCFAREDLLQLHNYITEALAREQMLENKLALLQRLVGQTGEASEEAWKSLIDEDRLLTRVEILESQLSTYGKAMAEDKLREETQRLMGEKELYQETAKETLKKLVDEKLEAVKKQKELEKALSNTEDEYGSLKELYEKYVQENRELALQVNRLRNELEEEIAARQKLSTENASDKQSHWKDEDSILDLEEIRLMQNEIAENLQNENADSQNSIETKDSNDDRVIVNMDAHLCYQQDNIHECIKANNMEKECNENNEKLLNIESELNTYKNTYEILVNQNTITNNALIDAQNKLRDVDTSQEQNNVEKELSEKLLNRESELNTYKNKYELLVNNSTTINNALIDAQKKLREVNTSLEQKTRSYTKWKLSCRKHQNECKMKINTE